MENCFLKSSFLSHLKKKSFHTACSLNGNQAASLIKKMFRASKQKSFFYQDTPSLPSSNMFSEGAFQGKKSCSSKRSAVLNKLFMRHITDLMATGECSKEFVGHGIEVNKIRVSPNYKVLNVYWVAKGNENDEVVCDILQKNAGLLRHELSQLRVMGVVPYIQFVKDKSYALIAEVDTRLAKADFGEDHEPLDLHGADKLKTELEMHHPQETNKKSPKISNEGIFVEIDDLPSMSQNVMGLDHAAILRRVVINMSKNKRKTQSEDGLISSLVTFNENPVEYRSHQEKRKAFREFLQQREIIRIKAKDRSKKYSLDMQYMDEENRDRAQRAINNVEEIYEEADFIIEDNEVDGKATE